MKKKTLVELLIVMICIIVVLLAVIGFVGYKDVAGTVNEVLSEQSLAIVIAIATSIISSVLFIWLTDIYEPSNADTVQNMVDRCAEESAEKIRNEFSSILQLNDISSIKYAPNYVFEGTTTPHVTFNEIVNSKLSTTAQYVYFGDKARYLAKRLKDDISTTNPKLKIWVVLPDIENDTLFFARKNVLQRMNRQLNRKMSVADQLVEEKFDVIRSVYQLSKLRDRYDITVLMHNEIPMFRFELTDDTLVISFISRLVDGNYYPPTLVYENDPVFHEAFLDYFESIKKRSKVLSLNDSTEEHLIKLGRKVIKKDFSQDDLLNSELIIGKERT